MVLVRALLQNLEDSDTILELQQTLEALPDEIYSLYDIIWVPIPPRKLPYGSMMVQWINRAGGPIPWLIMWLADEGRNREIRFSDVPDGNRKNSEQGKLRRRLAARTRRLIELTTAGDIDFIRRTAKDWANYPNMWPKICSACTESFEPSIDLIRAETVIMSDPSGLFCDEYFRAEVPQVLLYGFKAADKPNIVKRLIKALDGFDTEVTKRYNRAAPNPGRRHWTATIGGSYFQDGCVGRDNTYLGMAAQFAILPYVQEKVLSKPVLLNQPSLVSLVGLVEGAVLGGLAVPPISPTIPYSQRMAALCFLLDQGAPLGSECRVCVFASDYS